MLFWTWKRTYCTFNIRKIFLATTRVLIDVQKGNLILRINDEQITFNVFKATKFSSSGSTCSSRDTNNHAFDKSIQENKYVDPFEVHIGQSKDVIKKKKTSLINF